MLSSDNSSELTSIWKYVGTKEERLVGSAKDQANKKTIKAFFSSAYAPYQPEEQIIFNQYLNKIYSNLPKETVLFQGQDTNASLGVREDDIDDYREILGPYGLTARNSKGVDTLTMLQTHNIHLATTYFTHGSYTTWVTTAKQLCQLDHWLTTHMKYVHDAKVTDLGLANDHTTTILNLNFRIPKKERKLALTN